LRHVAKEELALLVLIISTGGVCQKAAVPAQPVATPRSRATAISAILPTLAGLDFYVAPAGSSAGDGSLGSPWDLATALSHPSVVHSGDTIWLRGGTYRGNFSSRLTGTASDPIIVRAYPAERVTIDGGNTDGYAILTVQGAYTWYWGFEITSSYGHRTTAQSGPGPGDIAYGDAITIDQSVDHPGLKFINLILHDTRQGFSWWKQAIDSEIYGCLIYNNGWIGGDHPHGHGIYAQNAVGLKTIRDSLLFRNFSHNLHAYTSASQIDNFYIRGNAFFEAGLMPDARRDLLVGGSVPAYNVIVRENTVYNSDDVGSDFQLGYGSPAVSPVILDNYLPKTGVSAYLTGTPTVSGNTLSRVDARELRSFPQNTWLDSPPTDTRVIVRPNAYEPGRGFVFAFNWRREPVVSVDLSAVLSLGSEYEVKNAFDVFAPPVVRGVYQEGLVSFPLIGLSTAAPVDLASAPDRDGVVQAFLVLTTGVGRLAPVPVSRPPRRTRSLD
jgi:hypothetical protein